MDQFRIPKPKPTCVITNPTQSMHPGLVVSPVVSPRRLLNLVPPYTQPPESTISHPIKTLSFREPVVSSCFSSTIPQQKSHRNENASKKQIPKKNIQNNKNTLNGLPNIGNTCYMYLFIF